MNLKEENTAVLLIIQTLLRRDMIGAIEAIIDSDEISRFHPSILKSMMIMLDGHPGLEEYYEKLKQIYLQTISR